MLFFFFSSRRRHTRWNCDWSSDVCSSDLAERMRRMREHLVQVERLHYGLQKQAWFLDAVEIYCDAVRTLAEELAERAVTSRGLDGFGTYLADYAASERFSSLAAETQALKEALAGIRYTLRIHGAKVTVSRYE